MTSKAYDWDKSTLEYMVSVCELDGWACCVRRIIEHVNHHNPLSDYQTKSDLIVDLVRQVDAEMNIDQEIF
jgi:hypothetical protein